MCFVFFSGLVLFLTFNRHSKSGYFNYHSEIWGDKAGYYVYLPAATKYNFNPEKFPDSIDLKTGNGFRLDYENKRVLTKYTSGVAILQLPFYLVADVLAGPMEFVSDGFSPIYHWSIDLAAVFYLMLGMFFLKRYLLHYFETFVVYLVLVSLFVGTNLYYYSVDETGMAHVYSFSLFCSYLYLLQKTRHLTEQKSVSILVLGIICGLIVLIRPTNVVFIIVCFFLESTETKETLSSLKLFRPKVFLLLLVGLVISLTPQLIYWKFTYGSIISYSYGNEGFNWAHPKLLQSWFSPNNGLFMYSPFYLLMVASLVYMAVKRMPNGAVLLGLFLGMSYVFASWHDWNFGCSFGARSYIEYLAVLSIPLAHLFNLIRTKKKSVVIGFSVLVIALILFNLKMVYSYDGCFFYEERNWDWNTYCELVLSPLK